MANELIKPLIVIQEGILAEMANTPVLVQAFPFLAMVKGARKTGCGRCNKTAAVRAETYQTVKKLIVGMAGDQKQKLKELMHATSIRVLYRRDDGKTGDLTF